METSYIVSERMHPRTLTSDYHSFMIKCSNVSEPMSDGKAACDIVKMSWIYAGKIKEEEEWECED